MPKDTDYEFLISAHDHPALVRLWQQIEASDTPGWDAGKALEYLILRAFQLEGVRVRWPYTVERYEQIDGFLYADGLTFLVECKGQSTAIDMEALAKVRHRVSRRPTVVMGCIFSRGGFTAPTLQQARFFVPQNVLLWTGEEIGYALTRQSLRAGLIRKYEHALEFGFPDDSLLKEDSK